MKALESTQQFSILEIRTFEHLKSNLVTVVIVVMAVTFLGQIVFWNGEVDFFSFGLAVALVIAALNFHLWIVWDAKSNSSLVRKAEFRLQAEEICDTSILL